MKMRILLLILCIDCAGFNPVFSMAPPDSSLKEMKILSWNLYMLPRFIKNTGKRKRARRIAAELSKENYDILVFQEAFHGGARRIIRKALKKKYPFVLGPANLRRWKIKTSSGVWMLSTVSLKLLKEIEYNACGGIPDCMARKGALLAEGNYNGQKFQILGTHIQSVNPVEIKLAQYSEIKNLLDEYYKDSIPQIIAGDFNMSKGSENYAKMLEIFGGDDYDIQSDLKITITPENDMRGYGNARLIDFIFYRRSGKKCSYILRNVRRFTYQWSKKHKDLSDHYAAEAIIRF